MRHAAAGSAAVLALCLTAAAACTPAQPDGRRTDASPSPSPSPTVHTAELRLPTGPAVVVGDADAAGRAISTSEELYVSAPVAVLAPTDDVAAQVRGAAIAVALGAPLLLADPAAAGESPTVAPTPTETGSPGRSGTDEDADAGADGTGADGTGADGTGEQPAAGPTDSAAPPGSTPADPVSDELERLDVLAVVTVGAAPAAPAEAVDGVEVHAAPTDDAQLAQFVRTPLLAAPAPAAGGEVATVAALNRDAPALPSAPTPEPDPAATEEPGTEDPGTEEPGTDEVSTEAPGPDETDPDEPGTDEPSTSTDSPLPLTEQAQAPAGGLVLTTGDVADVAALATARAAGLGVVTVPSGDPRVASSVVQAISAAQPTVVLGLGPAFGDATALGWKAETAETGVELPGGGQVLFPGRRMVALYGSPVTPALGLLGEQDLPGSVGRAERLAAEYQPLTSDVVVPAFELIVTVASSSAGSDGNYSNEWPVDLFRPWVEAARDAGIYVILDLQPGRTDFLTQARLYDELLLYPNVGLALDPEWRLEPDQVHLRQIGSVGIDEVNAVGDYLAELTRTNRLPQKLFVLHQFSLRMIQDRARLDTSHDELAVMIHADGQGSQGAKAGTWQALRADAPEGIVWGWKNFIDEDVPTLTPEQTYQVEPVPELVTYQ